MRARLLWLCLLLLLSGMESKSQPDERDLLAALSRFSLEYNKLAEHWNRGTFDVRTAKRLSRLWRDVETSGYWPREEKPK